MKKLFLIFLLGIFCGGCNLLELPLYAIFGKSSKNVKAEYRGLQGQKVAIVIATGPAVDFEYPYARMNVALASQQLITQDVRKVEFVDQEEIEKFQQENLDWASVPISDIAKKFGAQRVLYLDLYQFTMYEESSINLLRGQATAAVQVYETDQDNADQAAYRSEISVRYPENNPVAMSDAALQKVQFNTTRNFAEQLARKFYDHKLPIK